MIQIPRQPSLFQRIQDKWEIRLPFFGISHLQSTRIAMIGSIWARKALLLNIINLPRKRLQLLKACLHLLPTKCLIGNISSPLIIIIASTDGIHAKVDR